MGQLKLVAAIMMLAWASWYPVAIMADDGEVLRFEDLTAGTWGLDIEGVRCEENPHTIEFPDDGETMVLRYAKGVDGEPPTVATYDLMGEGPGYMRMQMRGEARTTEAGDPVEWDMVLLSPDSYCWHRTDWQDGGCTQPAHRCSEESE